MDPTAWVEQQCDLTLRRLVPRLENVLRDDIAREPESYAAFETRLRREWPRLFAGLLGLYGQQYDFFFHLEQLLVTLARSWFARPAALKQLDIEREANPDWFQSEEMMGAVLYVDLFRGTLAGLVESIPYFKALGLTYLHLMPLFAAPEGNSDGGYAVSSFRDVHPALGTMEELRDVSAALRAEGISLVLDFVFNHTSDEHEWARRAREGDPEYRAFYMFYPDRDRPDAYDRTLRDIFPAVRRGNFTYNEGLRQWVWTTFNSFQWDLNYSNPAVLRAMVGEMLFLANAGVEILRLDAVPFIWKELGTNSENLPQAHLVIQLFNAAARVAAPALLFKSEAIVHPDEVARYIRPDECQLSYNPLLMALLWEALATRETRLLAHSLRKRFRLPPGCSWVNYLRSHDDIGWTFDDGDAAELGINGYDHRRFLNAFYSGRFEGSFATGVPFQENPATGDARVAGTLASLAGLEQALKSGDEWLVEMAARRILMLHSIILSIGGIPLLYLGDELATLNDYTYRDDPAKADDSRWVHRPQMDWERAERRSAPATLEGRIYDSLLHLIELRKALPAFYDSDMEVVETGNRHLLAYTRGGRVLVVANFSEQTQRASLNLPALLASGSQSLLGDSPRAADLPGPIPSAARFVDLVTGAEIDQIDHADFLDQPRAVELPPYRFLWIARSAR